MKICICGIGQWFRGDDSAGLEAVRLYELRPPAEKAGYEIDVRAVASAGPTLLHILEGTDAALLIDCIVSGSAPGSIRRFEGPDLPAANKSEWRSSTHGFGVLAALSLMKTLPGKWPQVTMLGIEGESFSLGAPLSPPVAAVIDKVLESIDSWIGYQSVLRK